MKSSLITLAIFAGLSGTANAAESSVPSSIDAVTVFPQGADVTRLVDVKVAADESTLLLDDLPQTADPQSVRVEGLAEGEVSITSVDSKLVRVGEEGQDAGRIKLQAQFEALQDERAGLDQLIADKQAERDLLLALAQHPVDGKGDNAKPLDASALDTLVGTVATRLASTSKAIQDSHLRQRAIDKQVSEIAARMGEQTPLKNAHLQVKLHVHASKEAQAQFKVTYRVPEAGWHAFYDARLTLPSAGQQGKFNLVRQAEVVQHTSESWNNVKLTLSTAAVSESAEAPQINESEVTVFRPEPSASGSVSLNKLQAKRKDMGDLDVMSSDDKASESGVAQADAAPVSAAQAVVQQAGFTAQYVIAARSDIDNLGTAKNVRIGEDELPAQLSVETVPRLDENAYLTAAFTARADAPLLAGPVHLFRGAAYVGQVDMPELAGGEEAKLGFGVDDLVKVKRAEVKRLASAGGILSSTNTQEMAWVISLNNLHDVTMPVRILDRKPFSTDAQITVTDRADNTPATVTDVDHKRGVQAWDLTLEPKAKAEIKTGYKISAPKDVRVSLVD